MPTPLEHHRLSLLYAKPVLVDIEPKEGVRLPKWFFLFEELITCTQFAFDPTVESQVKRCNLLKKRPD